MGDNSREVEDEALKWELLLCEFRHCAETGCFLWLLNISPLRMMVEDYPWDIGGYLIYEGEILEKIIGDEAVTPGSGSGWV